MPLPSYTHVVPRPNERSAFTLPSFQVPVLSKPCASGAREVGVAQLVLAHGALIFMMALVGHQLHDSTSSQKPPRFEQGGAPHHFWLRRRLFLDAAVSVPIPTLPSISCLQASVLLRSWRLITDRPGSNDASAAPTANDRENCSPTRSSLCEVVVHPFSASLEKMVSKAVSAASTHFVQFCIQWSSIALLYYDYILTFKMEVRYIWGEKFRISTVLYVCCRYALVANVIYLLTIANIITGKYDLIRCLEASALSIAGRAAVVIVWAARTFAVFGRNRWILIFFGAIGLMVIILDIIEVPTNTCKGVSTMPLYSVGGLLAIMMCVFEILSAALCTFRSVQALNVNGPWWKQKKGFNYLVLEQGVLYFCVVTGLTISSLALNVAIPGGFLQRLLNAYTVPLSGLMTARFLLHLRKWEAKRDAFRSSTVNGGDKDEAGMSTNFDFTRQPHSHALSAHTNSESEHGTWSVSFMNEFGEDPVRRARERGSVGIDFARGDIVEEWRV
ncbi:hypothetical protein LshimejAT787_1900810 [Lyophyllum shimeji]|uniref:DUF6533 domain-containing protein n=1 Tax=Lyophyllum shimeji TaxID=47721 RepID=A0A9P3Q0R0_LYOSH|nr:hypothetical protein LshimejAT787_1900810 [Lyophyllum shimeji]